MSSRLARNLVQPGRLRDLALPTGYNCASMTGCPHCGKNWPDGYQRCPEDGATLSPIRMSGGSMMGNAAPELAEISDEDLPPGSHAGEYRIEKKIGEGGMGSVYGARHPLIGKRAAIKVIRRELSNSREAVDRFVLEAQSVNQIGHPNIVDVFGFGQLPDGRAFFVMEWLEGESLRDRLQRPLQFPEALEILEQIGKALQAAHEAGVVHRDLKPDNVYLQQRKGEKPTVKLLDFGLAKLTHRGDGGQQHDRTRTGVVMGTPLYLSPEQAKGAKIDAATDVYSLGAMAYEMLAGVVPFKADSAVEIMAMHISRTAIPLIQMAPWVPPEIDALVAHMLEKDARNRPQTAEVRERIAQCRSRASAATIGLQINPSSQPPPYTPQVPHGSMHTPMPGGRPTPMPPSMTPPMSMMGHSGYGSVGQSSSQQPSGSGKKLGLVIALLVLIGGGVGAVLFVAIGNKSKANEPPHVAIEQPAVTPEPAVPDPAVGAEPAKTEPVATGSATAEPAVGSGAEPVKTEPVKAEPVKTEPVKTEPVKTEPVKTVPVKTEPVKHTDAPKRGRVVVTFEGPSKAQVFVDGKAQGRETGGRVTLELTPGEHTVRVQAKGYKPADTTIRVEAGGSRDVKLSLEKRKSVNAVHDPFAD
jgi:serine/threonine-protein kinase